jgi:hypothetical protein
MRDVLIGSILLLIWLIMQFGMTISNGWIHIALIVGVIMLIKGIASSDAG